MTASTGPPPGPTPPGCADGTLPARPTALPSRTEGRQPAPPRRTTTKPIAPPGPPTQAADGAASGPAPRAPRPEPPRPQNFGPVRRPCPAPSLARPASRLSVRGSPGPLRASFGRLRASRRSLRASKLPCAPPATPCAQPIRLARNLFACAQAQKPCGLSAEACAARRKPCAQANRACGHGPEACAQANTACAPRRRLARAPARLAAVGAGKRGRPPCGRGRSAASAIPVFRTATRGRRVMRQAATAPGARGGMASRGGGRWGRATHAEARVAKSPRGSLAGAERHYISWRHSTKHRHAVPARGRLGVAPQPGVSSSSRHHSHTLPAMSSAPLGAFPRDTGRPARCDSA
jgi:hypothetical protein